MGLLGKQDARGTADARARLPSAPQTPIQGDNRLETRISGGGQRAARAFAPVAPNQLWTADLRYFWTNEGWLYLAVVPDPFNREVVGWSIKPWIAADIVVDALV